MKWISIRVSKFTRALHPDDYHEGLPQPGLDEGADRYRDLIVGNKGGTWVGRYDDAEAWLLENRTYEESKTIHYANDAKGKAPRKKATRKPRRQQEVLRNSDLEKEE
jgi:hypothetical protein